MSFANIGRAIMKRPSDPRLGIAALSLALAMEPAFAGVSVMARQERNIAGAVPTALHRSAAKPWIGKWSLSGSNSCGEEVGSNEDLVGFTATEIGEMENGGDIQKVSERDRVFTLTIIFNRGEAAGEPDIQPENRYVVISMDGKHAMIGSKGADHHVIWNSYDRCANGL